MWKKLENVLQFDHGYIGSLVPTTKQRHIITLYTVKHGTTARATNRFTLYSFN